MNTKEKQKCKQVLAPTFFSQIFILSLCLYSKFLFRVCKFVNVTKAKRPSEVTFHSGENKNTVSPIFVTFPFINTFF